MGHRITWRSRPRSDYPWPLRVKEVEESDLPGFGIPIEDYFGYVLIGPLTLSAITELVYRVKKMQCSGSVTITGIGEDLPFTEAFNGECKIADSVTESKILEAASTTIESGVAYGHALSNVSGFDTNMQFENFGYGASFFSRDADVWKTSLGYYLGGSFNGQNFVGAGFASSFYNFPAGSENVVLGTATLFLKSGSFIIPCRFGNPTGQPTATIVTITATEWWPYATTAGEDAWNTTTGAPANGGPAA